MKPRNGELLKHTETVLKLRKKVSKFKDRDRSSIPSNRIDGKRAKKWKDMEKYRKHNLQRQVAAKKTFYRKKAAESGRMNKLGKMGKTYVDGSSVLIIKRTGVHMRKPFLIRKLLKGLKLLKANEARMILPNTNQKRIMVNILWPYIEVTKPNSDEIKDLLFTRMSIKVPTKNKGKAQHKKLSSNVPVEEALGRSCDLVCIEDLVDQLANTKEHTSTILNHLLPFTLTKRTGKFIPTPLSRNPGMTDDVQR